MNVCPKVFNWSLSYYLNPVFCFSFLLQIFLQVTTNRLYMMSELNTKQDKELTVNLLLKADTVLQQIHVFPLLDLSWNVLLFPLGTHQGFLEVVCYFARLQTSF